MIAFPETSWGELARRALVTREVGLRIYFRDFCFMRGILPNGRDAETLTTEEILKWVDMVERSQR